MCANAIWLGMGFLGQAFFSCRFLVQWLVSERQKRSIIPHAFWYFSLLGGATLLAYAIYKEDPVFVVGQVAGLLIYSRNLYFLRRAARAKANDW
ncbi:MAG: lipid-A-disaccharide synthase N-terminal domain-containing protein [Alphaproteobacteria bacterium]